MLKKIYIDNIDHTDLNMYRCGIEDCAPDHSWGPAVRDHFIIHYILNGRGSFQCDGKTYKLSKGQGFLLRPNVITYYQADTEFPWSYTWVGFHGIKAASYLKRANLTSNNPVFQYDKDDFVKQCFDNMIAANSNERSSEIRMLGYLYILLSHLIEHSDNNNFNLKNRKEVYIKKAIQFIEMNYSRKISVMELSKYVGLDRSYLSSLFKQYLNSSPQEFLINYRINKACELMNNNLLSIGDIARSVGYDDPLLFSKAFKKNKGSSPRTYRKSHI